VTEVIDFPTRFGKYELLERLAMGGMAEVFLARSFGVEGFEKHLVIKRILPGLARSPRFIKLFIKEAKITAGLAHPNIVQTYELGRVGEDHYIAMEYIHGQDLTRVNRALRAEQFRMPMGLAVYTVAKMLRGLGFAHTLSDAQGRPLNLVHRDVSPHNVMLSYQGEVKIFDFGIARLLGDTMGVENQVAPRGGKFAYMSPEQATGRPMDPRSDIYSAGIVLYELLVGQRLFKHSDPQEKLRMVREADIADPRQQHPNIPEALWAILKRMLAADPGDRPDRAELAEEELWGFLFSYGLRADAKEMRAFLQDLYPDQGGGVPRAWTWRGWRKTSLAWSVWMEPPVLTRPVVTTP
jgi:serine/threonine protein kinase